MQEEAAAGEWAAILSLENEEEPPAEGITVEDLNKVFDNPDNHTMDGQVNPNLAQATYHWNQSSKVLLKSSPHRGNSQACKWTGYVYRHPFWQLLASSISV